jgi:hypothetical protein
MAEPREADVVFCFDCGYVGNRPEVIPDQQYGWEDPWEELVCPECGESAGPLVHVREVREVG